MWGHREKVAFSKTFRGNTIEIKPSDILDLESPGVRRNIMPI